jgi:BON domain
VTAKGAEERYLPEHLHEALLADGRVGEQDLQVVADAHCIHVTGSVATPDRRDAIVQVVAELAPGWEICNEVEVTDVASGPDVEDVTG